MNTLKLQNSIFKIIIELFIWNKKARSKAKANWTKWHLKKYVNKAIKETQIENIKTNNERPIIWQYWHQGIENAPLLIQKCIESTKKFHPDYEIKVLSFENINDYVDIPKKYYDLLEQKKIPIAIFSDILRLYLLTKYGGCWVDATLYFTGRIPDKILNSKFFVPQKNPKTDAFGDKMSCYFIRSDKDSIWIHLIKNAIENYWNENDYLIHYFMFEHVVSMISESTKELKNDWKKMPFILTQEFEIFRKNLYDTYSDELFKEIKKTSFMHKLSYKIIQNSSNSNTFYDKIINNELF
ncbi:MAG: hypothetical protein IJ003_03685 [Candidatus Gastranaerophilales bacterium]|nr:hypothetical protein [Candidatus Gastranaerophilales bacterium]